MPSARFPARGFTLPLGRAIDQHRIGVVDVDVDAARRSPQRRERTVRRRRSACGPCGGRSCCRCRLRIISSSVNSVPSNSTTSARGEARAAARASSRRRPARTRAAPRRRISTPTLAAPLAVVAVAAFQIERHLAGQREQLGLDPARSAKPARRDRAAATPHQARARRTSDCRDGPSVSAVAYEGERRRSRKFNRPATWSISAPVSTTASIGLWRVSPRGCSAGVATICARRSGEAFSRIQCSPSPDTARLACVRAKHACPRPRRAGRRGSDSSTAESRLRPPNPARWRSDAIAAR